MEKYCYWEYLDGTKGPGGLEVHFQVPATRRYDKLVGALPPQILALDPVLQAYCARTAVLKAALSGGAFVKSEHEWKWLNETLATYLRAKGHVPSERDGVMDMFRLGEWP